MREENEARREKYHQVVFHRVRIIFKAFFANNRRFSYEVCIPLNFVVYLEYVSLMTPLHHFYRLSLNYGALTSRKREVHNRKESLHSLSWECVRYEVALIISGEKLAEENWLLSVRYWRYIFRNVFIRVKEKPLNGFGHGGKNAATCPIIM